MDGLPTDAPEMEDPWHASAPVARTAADRWIVLAGGLVLLLGLSLGLGLAISAIAGR